MNAKHALARIKAPDERAAEERAWAVVRAAYGESERVRVRRRPRLAPALLLAAAAAAAGTLALSPAGANVTRLLTRALGFKPAAPALFSLPAPGRLLVSGPGGTWTIAANGAMRRVGPWRQASWSPRGLFITASGGDQLVAVDPLGRRYWAIARPSISDPEWYPPTGFRIAYRSGGGLRVVAGDGTEDHLVAAGVAPVAPAWRPGHPYQLAFFTRTGAIVVRDGDSLQTLWTNFPGPGVRVLAWSADGRRLLAVSSGVARVYDPHGRLVSESRLPAGATSAALSPDGRRLALVLAHAGGGAAIVDLAAPRAKALRILTGATLASLTWSPDGRWLLASWPAADQWVFVRLAGMPRLAAFSRISEQFGARGFPRLEGWCCTSIGTAG